jgi:hypothetical protein
LTAHVFGIRHHGPGSARSLRAALEGLAPDCVLVEGPPDADGVAPLLAHPAMKPPVALLVYAEAAPAKAVYYPFTTFSPEWQAIAYSLERGVPLRFMDLPIAHQLDDTSREDEDEHDDPLGALAEAAGYDDREAWWEHIVERRQRSEDLFVAIAEAMRALREGHTPGPREARREAWMRRTLRAAEKEGFQRIAVVCGAWHVPALETLGPKKADDEILRGLPKTKVVATWIPWTNSRLAYRSGYGAGVEAPGWYEHLWAAPGNAALHWIVKAARLLRDDDLDASSASVIEAARLADALAALRGHAVPGLPELREAILSVLCHGEASRLAAVRTRLEIGEALGDVPDDAPSVPLQRDIEAHQRSLRLKVSAEIKPLELDLRKDTDRAKSVLLHRLALLAIPWAKLTAGTGTLGTGTFREVWQLQWQPAFAVAVVEANVFGNTVDVAAAASVAAKAQDAALPALTALIEATLPAALPSAVDGLLSLLEARAAVSSDAGLLMAALPPLARLARYGDVRETDAAHVLPIVRALFERIVVGLPGATAALDDDTAATMVDAMDGVRASVALLELPALRDEWLAALEALAAKADRHGLLRGRITRWLHEAGRIDDAALLRAVRLALSVGEAPRAAASFVEGLVRGSGLVLLQQDGVWLALDEWVRSLAKESFVELLPLVRRSFAEFDAPARRQMGDRVKRLASAAGPRPAAQPLALDFERARRTLPVLATLLGAADA